MHFIGKVLWLCFSSVFSDREPRTRSLSLDRWKIFLIKEGKLVGDFEEEIWKQQKDDHTKAPKMCQDKNEIPRHRGAFEIYHEITTTLSSVSLKNRRKEHYMNF